MSSPRRRRHRNEFLVEAPAARVGIFHSDPASMAEITPPGIRVSVHTMPSAVVDDASMEFSLRIGPISVPWSARFEDVSATGFTDRLVSGPFREWVHQHAFEERTPTTTAVIDEIHAVFGTGIRDGFVSRAMWYGLPILFAFRAWKTRRILGGD